MIVISQRRKIHAPDDVHRPLPPINTFSDVAEKLEILREREDYLSLAWEYHRLGNKVLRDKYIELAERKDSSDASLIFFRGLQGEPDKINKRTLNQVIKRQTDSKDWTQLARTYFDMGDYDKSIANYCKGILELVEQGEQFSAAFYIKEMANRALHVPLLMREYEEREAAGDLWWSLRCLQDLGWHTEAKEFLLRNQEAILASDDKLLQKSLHAARGDKEAYKKIDIELTESMFRDPATGVISFRYKRGSGSNAS